MGEMLRLEDVMKDPHKEWPTFTDLERKEVLLDENLIEKVEELLESNRYCLIRGAEGRGKTVLSRVVGFNKHKKGWKVYFINVRELGEEDIDNICRQIGALQDRKTLFIIENAHASLDEITPKLIESANDYQKPSFIFTSRKIFPGEESLLITNPFEEYEEKGWYVDLIPNLRMMQGIIEKFISAREIQYSLTEEDISWLKREFGEQSVNLRRLRWYLETWSEMDCPLHSVPKEKVLEKVLKDFLIQELKTLGLRKMLFRVAAVFQFDVNFYGKNFDEEILTELVRKGLITFLSPHYYRMQHSTDAAYVIEAEAILIEKEKPEVLTAQILKEYLQTKPINFLGLMDGIYRNEQKSILSQIFENQETYNAILDMVKQDGIRAVSSVLRFISWSCGRERGSEFWSQYKKLLGDFPEEQVEKLKGKLTEASLGEIKSLLSFLMRVEPKEKDWLVTVALDEDILAQKAKETSLKTISDVLDFLPGKKASGIISKLDARNVAEKANAATARHIMWFLKHCLRAGDPSNINFVKSFLLIIHENDKLVEKLKDSDLGITLECLRLIKKINREVYKDITDALSSHWLQIWLSSSLNSIANQLYKYRWSVGEPKKLAQSVVNGLASKSLAEPIKRLSSNPQIKPFKALGKLLNSAYQVAFEADKDAVGKISREIVDNLDLKTEQKYTIEQLSLLVSNVRRCSEEAYSKLCSRILSELNLFKYITIPFDKGLAMLMWEIY